jgi:hypothetical protein
LSIIDDSGDSRNRPYKKRGNAMTKDYKGSCHCGSIHFSFKAEEITHGVRCNCSICARKGAMMTSDLIPEAEFNIEAKAGTLGCYQFGAKTAKHYFCKVCGIYTFHESSRAPGHMRANLGCLEGVDSLELPYDLFDGKHLL